MASTANLTKTPTTRGEVQIGDIIDGEKVTNVEEIWAGTDKDGNARYEVRFHFRQAGGYGPYLPADQELSVWR